MGIRILYAVWILFGISAVNSHDDSLRSALNALDRRQRYYYENPVLHNPENPTDLSYLPDSDAVGDNDFIDYIEDNDIHQQVPSSFRERQEDREKQIEELSPHLLYNWENDDPYDSSIYRPRDPWSKYRNNPRNNNNDRARSRKRQFYPEFGYAGIGLRKRKKYTPTSYSKEYNYLNLNDDYPGDYIDELDYPKRSASYQDQDNTYEYLRPNYWSNFRHIPVAKRSSEYPQVSKDKKKQNQSVKTDPKIEKDLRSVFSDSEKKKVTKYPKKVEEESKIKNDQKKSNTLKSNVESGKNDTKKHSEQMSSEKPIQISKKSIDWSDYFGLDRRKKNKDDSDKEWLMERYHNAISLSKKNNENLSQSHRGHEGTKKTKKSKNEFDDSKLESMERKLKTIEDEIVDDALKYTGANEGVTDPKDVKEVEDGIISRLAKAYSIEKMRRALGEYKMLVEKEREKLKDDDFYNDSFTEEKRVSVPRKQAVDTNEEDKVETNQIKCTQGSTGCNEENYKMPIEIMEQMNYEVGGCPRIQRNCRQVAPMLEPYAKVFEEACNIYQMCMICGNNNWYPATRQCNILYMNKVFDMCNGKDECQKELEKSVGYLLSINRNIRNNLLGDCNLVCPDGPDGP